MRQPNKLQQAIASAVLAGSFALAAPGIASAQSQPDADGYFTGPAYLPPEPDETMLKVICTSLLRTEIAKELGVEENVELTAELKDTEFDGTSYECEPVVEPCQEGADSEACFEPIIVEE